MDYFAQYHSCKRNDLEDSLQQNIASIVTVFSKSTIYAVADSAFDRLSPHFHKRKSQFLFDRIAINTPISSAYSRFFAQERKANA